MEIVSYILNNTTMFIIIVGILIACAGFLLLRLRIVSIVCIILAALIIYVLLYKTSPIPTQPPEPQENKRIDQL